MLNNVRTFRHIFFNTSLFIGVFLTFSPTVTHAAVTPDDPNNFITTWNTENSGSSNDNQIIIPGTGSGYNYEIYWENVASSTMTGTTSPITTSSYTLTFPEPGIYEVQASGTFPRIYFNNSGDKNKILTVDQWGDNAWTSMYRAFRGASNLRVPATDAPDLSGVTSLRSMFRAASAFNDPINHWDVSSVANMMSMFKAEDGGFVESSFNQPLDQWDVSNVTNMRGMFGGTTEFNQPLNSWDVSNVTRMDLMFQFSAFNQPLDQWDVGNVTTMWEMFIGTPFNQPLNTWDTGKLQDMRFMFAANPFFNQPLDQWDTSSVTDMNSMFRGARSFDQDLSNWNIANVTAMDNMFATVDTIPPDFLWVGLSQNNRDAVAQLYESDTTSNPGLSTQNQDATLNSFATQAASSTIENIPFHIGLKNYSQTGAEAIQTLESLGWTITEQYQATYRGGPNATLIGSSYQAPLGSGATTTPVEIKPDARCTFLEWSDGNTDNPRSDVLTDNLFVTAEVQCASRSGGTSASRQIQNLEAMGKYEEADALRDRFPGTANQPASSSTTTPNLTDTLDTVQAFLDTPRPLTPSERSMVQELLALLLELVQALGQLLLLSVEESAPVE